MNAPIDWASSRLLHGAGMLGPIVLMYHSIDERPDGEDTPWRLSLDTFRHHLDLFAAADWSTAPGSALNAPETLPPRTVVITFDDGYANNFAAFEALRDRGMTATWFIVTDTIGQRANWKDYFFGTPMLDSGQLRTMRESGMEIGSHGKTHSNLAMLDADALNRELAGSRAALEDTLGVAVDQVAYPNGHFNEAVVKTAAETGYRLGYSCHAGHALADFDPFVIKRIAIFRGDSPSRLARKLAFAANDASWFRVARYGLRRIRAKAAAFAPGP